MAHLIFVCKYRKELLGMFGIEIKSLMYDVAEENNFEIIEMEADKNHIYISYLEKRKQQRVFAEAFLDREYILER